MKYAEVAVSRKHHDLMLPDSLDKESMAMWCSIRKSYTARCVVFHPRNAYQADYINRRIGALFPNALVHGVQP
jgi:S-adenosylmethionine:diacylglycerol 3-amino-3-carboxypropyl transferase